MCSKLHTVFLALDAYQHHAYLHKLASAKSFLCVCGYDDLGSLPDTTESCWSTMQQLHIQVGGWIGWQFIPRLQMLWNWIAKQTFWLPGQFTAVHACMHVPWAIQSHPDYCWFTVAAQQAAKSLVCCLSS